MRRVLAIMTQSPRADSPDCAPQILKYLYSKLACLSSLIKDKHTTAPSSVIWAGESVPQPGTGAPVGLVKIQLVLKGQKRTAAECNGKSDKFRVVGGTSSYKG